MRLRHLILLVCVSLILVLALATVAKAITFEGGDNERREAVLAALDYGWVDRVWFESRFSDVHVIFRDGLFLNSGHLAVAWSPNNIVIDSGFSPSDWYFVQTVRHEWAHMLWFRMEQCWQARWTRLCTGGSLDYGATWMTKPSENFAECMRAALWYDETYEPNTSLRVIPPGDCKVFVRMWQRSVNGLSYPQ